MSNSQQANSISRIKNPIHISIPNLNINMWAIINVFFIFKVRRHFDFIIQPSFFFFAISNISTPLLVLISA
jgi:hypothetical protein